MGELKQALGFFDIYMMAMGNVMGAGIFVLLSETIKHSKKFTWLAFLIAGVLALMSGFSYIEFSNIFKSNAGESEYIGSAFGELSGIITTGILLILNGLNVSSVAFGLGKYIEQFYHIPYMITSAISIIVFGLINIVGVEMSSFLNIICTFIEYFGLAAIFVPGMLSKNLDLNFKWKDMVPLQSLSMASLISIFSYIGFETTIRITEEAKNPDRDIPLALIACVITSVIIYILTSLTVTNLKGMGNAISNSTPLDNVAALLYSKKYVKLFNFVAFIGVINTILVTLLANSRMLYSISEKIPKTSFLRYVNKDTQTPVYSIIAVTIFSLFLLLINNLEKLAGATCCVFFIVLAMVNLSLMKLYIDGNHKEKLKETFIGKFNNGIPITPTLGFASCVGLLGYCLCCVPNFLNN